MADELRPDDSESKSSPQSTKKVFSNFMAGLERIVGDRSKILEKSFVWFMITTVGLGGLSAFKAEDMVRKWADDVVQSQVVKNHEFRQGMIKQIGDSNEFRGHVEGWAADEAKSVVDSSDEKRVTALINKIVNNDSLRVLLVDKLRQDEALRQSVAAAMMDDPRIMEQLQGKRGPVGLRGPKGATGDKGPPGDKGPVGDKGPRGNVGPKGPVGDKGATGDRGPVGDRGPAGEKGECTCASAP